MRDRIKKLFGAMGYEIRARNSHMLGPLKRPTDPDGLEVLEDANFQASVLEVLGETLLDTARLANLWQLCRKSNSKGAVIEVGVFRGGSALHISNSAPDRQIYVCDTFQGFRGIPMDEKLDRSFGHDWFAGDHFDHVRDLFQNKERDVEFIRGVFPESARDVPIAPLSFAHLDLDLYESTLTTLEFLSKRMVEKSIIVFDDFCRNADGVMKAVQEFEENHSDWRSFPIFPGQGIMINASWFD